MPQGWDKTLDHPISSFPLWGALATAVEAAHPVAEGWWDLPHLVVALGLISEGGVTRGNFVPCCSSALTTL